jgi:glycosyltransferase involved in cell wall biosynthesis
MKLVGISVLMSVYFKDSAVQLRESLDSILSQSLLPEQIVLVQDGPLSDGLYLVIEEFKTKYTALIDCVILNTNRGLGNALKVGLQKCKYDLIARMDADDICRPERFEKQFNFLINYPCVDVVGSNIEEFNKVPGDLGRFKICPESHEELVKRINLLSPFNHPSIMMRKAALIKAGGYSGDLLFFEDYSLFLRLWKSGARFHNIQEVLLDFRVGDGLEMIRKRSGINYLRKEREFLNYGYSIGAFSKGQLIRNKIIRFPIRLLPPRIVLFIYNTFLRK